jgi:hypothetical protein
MMRNNSTLALVLLAGLIGSVAPAAPAVANQDVTSATMAVSDTAAPATAIAPAPGPSFAELIAMSNDELDTVLQGGTAPDLDALVGWEFRGFNPPVFAKILGFQKFIKGFVRDEAGKVYGYNLFVEDARGGPDAPWTAKGDGGPDTRHGFYDIVPLAADTGIDGVLLDYGSGRNAWYNPEAVIRDQLVQVSAGNPDLLLGKAFLQIGPGRIFSNFFILERLRPVPAAE